MKTYFVISTVNGRELDYWRFDTREAAEDWIATNPFDSYRYRIVVFQTTGRWTPA